MKAKDDQDFCFLWWLWKEPFWTAPQVRFKIFLNFSNKEQLTVSFISFWFYQAVD